VENDRSGVVKIEQTDSAPWLNSNTYTRFGSSLENTWIIRAQTPSYRVARNMVIVARKQPHARHAYAGSARSHSTFLVAVDGRIILRLRYDF